MAALFAFGVGQGPAAAERPSLGRFAGGRSSSSPASASFMPSPPPCSLASVASPLRSCSGRVTWGNDFAIRDFALGGAVTWSCAGLFPIMALPASLSHLGKYAPGVRGIASVGGCPGGIGGDVRPFDKGCATAGCAAVPNDWTCSAASVGGGPGGSGGGVDPFFPFFPKPLPSCLPAKVSFPLRCCDAGCLELKLCVRAASAVSASSCCSTAASSSTSPTSPFSPSSP
mmetsp:Transcript_79393/g.220932  ORF Transcript_79393/g.220932 Transcript_79393/m.220932 type:complete len:228 (-) Transcript_79393:290-973(-)